MGQSTGDARRGAMRVCYCRRLTAQADHTQQALVTLSASSPPCNWSSDCYACLASDLLKQQQLAVRSRHQSRGPENWPAKHLHYRYQL